MLDLNTVLRSLDSAVTISGGKLTKMCHTHLHGKPSMFDILRFLDNSFLGNCDS